MSLKNKLDKCFKEGEKSGERHKGLRKIGINKELIDKHLEKAAHNLNAVSEFKNIGYSDWSASAAFYALYHCLLALLVKFGHQSKHQECSYFRILECTQESEFGRFLMNQNCTFAFVEDLINRKKISLNLEELKEIFDRDITEDLSHSEKILDIRETMQYSFKTSLNDKEFNKLLERTKLLFDKLRREIEK